MPNKAIDHKGWKTQSQQDYDNEEVAYQKGDRQNLNSEDQIIGLTLTVFQ
jgi:hypothetical protein